MTQTQTQIETKTEIQVETADRVYKPHPRYRWMALGSVLLFFLLAWNLFSPAMRSGQWAAVTMDVGALFFMGAAIGVAVWQGRMALSRVTLTSTGVSLSVPLARLQHVEFRQLSSVSESGRGGRVITLLYHPIGVNQLVDGDDIKGLTLPEVVDQDSLIDRLEEGIPS
jgi:hypothetical protein